MFFIIPLGYVLQEFVSLASFLNIRNFFESIFLLRTYKGVNLTHFSGQQAAGVKRLLFCGVGCQVQGVAFGHDCVYRPLCAFFVVI